MPIESVTPVEGSIKSIDAFERILRRCVDGINSIALKVDTLSLRVESLEQRIRTPSIRPKLPTTVDARDFAQEVKSAAVMGERLPNTTPDAEVEKVLERVDLIRKGRILNRILWLAFSGVVGLGGDEFVRVLFHYLR